MSLQSHHRIEKSLSVACSSFNAGHILRHRNPFQLHISFHVRAIECYSITTPCPYFAFSCLRIMLRCICFDLKFSWLGRQNDKSLNSTPFFFLSSHHAIQNRSKSPQWSTTTKLNLYSHIFSIYFVCMSCKVVTTVFRLPINE